MEDLNTLFPPGGLGVIATADAGGKVNIAVYAKPRVTGSREVAWGMTDGRTWANLQENPSAAFLYMNPGSGYAGVRLGLTLLRAEDDGVMLEAVRTHTAEVVSPAAAAAVRHVGYFSVDEIRPLV